MTPDAFLSDWYGWLTNQMAHALLGLVLTALLAWALGSAMSRAFEANIGMKAPALLIVVVVYFIGWEGLWQVWGAGMGDAMADAAFVALGGAIGVSAWARKGGIAVASVGATVAMLSVGVWRRK